MKIAVFSKKKTTKDGKAFYIYLSTLTKKDGSEIPVRVHFREECGQPDPHTCPCFIFVDKKNANLAKEEYTTEEGEVRLSYHLWVNKWKTGGEYVDKSLDDFSD